MNQQFIIDFVSWLFDYIYQYILFTPFELFKSPAAISVLIKMGIFGGSLVTILTMLEGIKRMVSMKYTSISQVLVRYPIALSVSALAPFLFYFTGWGANEIVKLMGLITQNAIGGKAEFATTLQGVGEHVMEILLLLVFLIVMAIYIIRILLFHAGRWFGLLFNMVTTPIAMTAFIFKSYESIASSWLKDTLFRFFVVIVHSIFLGIIGILLYSPATEWADGAMGPINYMLVKILFAIGGLQMMLKPPAWVSRWFDKGDSIADTKRAFKPVTKFVSKTIFRR